MSEQKRRRGEEEKGRNDERGMMNDELNSHSSLITHHSSLPSPCDLLAPELKAYADGQLGWWARRRVRRHTANCASCREEMQAMRDFSRFLQEGTGETLSPQLRARILAAVPETVPAASTAQRIRPVTRPMLAWGAAASALILCIILTPLFFNNERVGHLQNAATSSSLSDKNSAGESTAAGGSSAGSAAGAANPAAAYKEMKKSETPVLPAASAPFGQEKAAVAAPKTLSGKPPPTAMPDDKSDTMQDSASYAATTGIAPPNIASAEKGAAVANGVSPAPGTREYEADRSALRPASPANRQAQTGGKTDAARLNNKKETAPGSAATGSVIASAKSSIVTPPNTESMMPPPVAKLVNPPMPKKASRAISRNSEEGKSATNDILLVVANVEQSRAALEQTVKSNGGAISAVKDVTYADNTQAAMLTLDVPADRVSTLLSELDMLGEREPFVSTPETRRKPTVSAHGATAKNAGAVANKMGNVRADSGSAFQSRPTLPSQPPARNTQNIITRPSVSIAKEPKSSADFDSTQSSARVTIHLQQKDKR